MDRPRDYHISVEVRKINTIRYMWNLSYNTNKHIYEIETGLYIYIEQTCGSQAGVRRKEGRIGSLGFGDSNCYTKGG